MLMKKGKTMNGKERARVGGAYQNKARCKPSRTTNSGGPAEVHHRRSV